MLKINRIQGGESLNACQLQEQIQRSVGKSIDAQKAYMASFHNPRPRKRVDSVVIKRRQLNAR